MAGRRRIQFGIVAMLGLILVVAIIARMWAPEIEFQRMISGHSPSKVQDIVITGQGRRLTIKSRQAMEYITDGIMRSTREGRAFHEDHEAGVPPRRYHPYTLHIRTSSGYYSVYCQISAKDCCMFIPFEESIADGEEPNRRFDFVEPIPPDVVEILEFLFCDLDDKDQNIENVVEHIIDGS
ncbi:hypothetical protein GC197_12985 [bacterium]|nr:hypothetical protein [bacterium]